MLIYLHFSGLAPKLERFDENRAVFVVQQATVWPFLRNGKN
jgi:hypothetical protein